MCTPLSSLTKTFPQKDIPEHCAGPAQSIIKLGIDQDTRETGSGCLVTGRFLSSERFHVVQRTNIYASGFQSCANCPTIWNRIIIPSIPGTEGSVSPVSPSSDKAVAWCRHNFESRPTPVIPGTEGGVSPLRPTSCSGLEGTTIILKSHQRRLVL